MRLSALNKFIAVFLVGSVPTIWIALREIWFAGDSALHNLSNLFEHGVVATSAAFVIVSIIIGTAVDALVDVFLRQWLEKRKRIEKFAPFFGQRKEHKNLQRWATIFSEVFRESNYRLCPFEEIPTGKDEHATNTGPKGDPEEEKWELDKYTAAGIFLKHASQQQFEWLSSTYSNRILCTGFFLEISTIWIVESGLSVFSCVFQFHLEVFSWSFLMIALVIVLILDYAFISRSIESYLYSYTIGLRFSVLHCREKMMAQTTGAT
jgi:hypothetical protein